MNAETKTNTVETILASSHAMLTVNDLRRITGLDEKTVRAQLKTLAQQGQIDHIPGRGRYDGKYGLLRTTPQTAVKDSLTVQAPAGGDSEGVEADVRAIPAPEYDPNSVSFKGESFSDRAVEAAVNQYDARADLEAQFNGFDVSKLPPILISCVAKLWPDSQGMFWEQFIERMPDRINELKDALKNGESAKDEELLAQAALVVDLRAELAATEQKRLATTAELTKAMKQLDAIREHLSPFPVGIDPSSMTEVELAESAANAIRDGLERIFSTSSDDGASEKLVSDLRAELANATALNDKLEHLLGVERQTSAALREQLDHITHGGESAATGLCASQIDSFAVIAPKRPMRRFTGHDSAVKSAMAAASNGSKRGEVFALVHVGTAKRGAVWSPTK